MTGAAVLLAPLRWLSPRAARGQRPGVPPLLLGACAYDEGETPEHIGF